jgi:hypothetical protein
MLSLDPTAIVAASEIIKFYAANPNYMLQEFPVAEVAELFTNSDPAIARATLEGLLHVGTYLTRHGAKVSAPTQ